MVTVWSKCLVVLVSEFAEESLWTCSGEPSGEPSTGSQHLYFCNLSSMARSGISDI